MVAIKNQCLCLLIFCHFGPILVKGTAKPLPKNPFSPRAPTKTPSRPSSSRTSTPTVRGPPYGIGDHGLREIIRAIYLELGAAAVLFCSQDTPCHDEGIRRLNAAVFKWFRGVCHDQENEPVGAARQRRRVRRPGSFACSMRKRSRAIVPAAVGTIVAGGRAAIRASTRSGGQPAGLAAADRRVGR